MIDRFVSTKHGRIHCRIDGEGPPLILLHSNGGSAFEFEHAMEPLSRSAQAIAWDMPGHGDSDALTTHRSVEDFADAVIALMDGLGIERASVCGSSIGGAISVALAARHADRIDRAIPVETPVRKPEEWVAGWATTERMFGEVVQGEAQVRPRLRAFDAAHLQRWNIDRAKAGAKAMIGVMWALRDYDVVADAARVRLPTLLLYGAKGPTLARASLLADAMSDARIATIADAQHFPMLDDPAAFAAAIADFLAQ